MPILHGCLGVLVCKARGWPVDVGDHEVWFGEVVEVLKEEKGVSGTDGGVRKDPLVYFQSSYRSVGDEVFIQAFESATLAVEMWTHRAHLRFASCVGCFLLRGAMKLTSLTECVGSICNQRILLMLPI